MGTEGFHRESKANQKKRSISNQIEQQTLTLEQRAVGSDLHRPTAGRPRAGQIRAARFVGARDRTLRRSPPGRRGARARARKQGAIHGELDGGALTHRRARTPASKPQWRRSARSARPPWPVAVASVAWREKGERKNELGFEGRRVVVGFDPANRAGDRPIKIDGRDRASPPGLAGGPFGRGRGRRGGPIRRPGRWLSGLGPKERWPSRPRAGFAPGLLNSVFRFIVFSIFPEAISIVF